MVELVLVLVLARKGEPVDDRRLAKADLEVGPLAGVTHGQALGLAPPHVPPVFAGSDLAQVLQLTAIEPPCRVFAHDPAPSEGGPRAAGQGSSPRPTPG